MDPSAVVLRYSLEKWCEHTGLSLVSGLGPQKHSRRRHLVPLLATSFERPVAESLHNMRNYSGEISGPDLGWYHDITNVAQRLKFLRDTYKVIQSVRKKKMMGERADFRSLYDTKVGRPGLAAGSDDEHSNSARADDDYTAKPPAAVPARRGRPRKKRGRDRKSPLGREDAGPGPGRPPKRSRVSRRLQENERAPADRQAPSLTATPEPAQEQSRRLSFGRPEPQGPPLMHLPPILPTQKYSLVQGIPPYRHLMGPAAVGVPPDLPVITEQPPALPSTNLPYPPPPTNLPPSLPSTLPPSLPPMLGLPPFEGRPLYPSLASLAPGTSLVSSREQSQEPSQTATPSVPDQAPVPSAYQILQLISAPNPPSYPVHLAYRQVQDPEQVYLPPHRPYPEPKQ